MAAVIFCFDNRLATQAYHYVPYKSNVTTHRMIVSSAWSIPAIAHHIRSLAGSDKIRTLHLLGHGYPGSLQLGTGLNIHTTKDFYALNGSFESMGIIRIHGCSVASSSVPTGGKGTWTGGSGAGYHFLWYLAWYTNAWVEAAIHTQYYDPLFTFEGPSVTVLPNGSFSYSH